MKIGLDADGVPLNGEWPIISLLRFLCAFIVFCSHLGMVGARDNSFAAFFFSFGSAEAVLAFFIISGYSIANSIKSRPSGFYHRRLFRIYPVYLFSLICGLLPFFLISNKLNIDQGNIQISAEDTGWINIVASIFLLQTFTGKTIGLLGLAWSLSIEWIFYLFTPLLEKLKLKNLLIIAILLLLTWIALSRFRAPFNTYYWELKYGFAALMVGWAWIGGYIFGRYRNKYPLTAIILFLIFTLAAMTLNRNQALAFSGSLGIFTVVCAALIIVFARYVNISECIGNFFNYMGELSFALYMIHIPLIISIYNLNPKTNAYFYTGFVLIGTLIVYHFIDKKFRFKRNI